MPNRDPHFVSENLRSGKLAFSNAFTNKIGKTQKTVAYGRCYIREKFHRLDCISVSSILHYEVLSVIAYRVFVNAGTTESKYCINSA